ncbi:MAG: helix-turn-helix transcriptional regulator, partial [Oscillospiraceae bacterium]|nr:helix-turn-helix transcriptional regulator [Oscillospiraceae bacterium]
MENQRVRLTKRMLKDALISLMQDRPFDRITVKRLCEEAGINRTTFYLHYADTEQLL